MKEIMALHYILRKKKKTTSNLENLPEALARPQLLQAACRFEINNPSGNFFSGPRLTALERELTLNWASERSEQSCLGSFSLVSHCLESPKRFPCKTPREKSFFITVPSAMWSECTWAVVDSTPTYRFPKVSSPWRSEPVDMLFGPSC